MIEINQSSLEFAITCIAVIIYAFYLIILFKVVEKWFNKTYD